MMPSMHTHKFVSVRGDLFINIPLPPSMRERMGGRVERNVVGDRVKDTSFPRMHTKPQAREPSYP